jgi:hypothetical protein
VALRENGSTHKLEEGDELVWEMEAEFSVFGFLQILEATSNFSEENKLGESWGLIKATMTNEGA